MAKTKESQAEERKTGDEGEIEMGFEAGKNKRGSGKNQSGDKSRWPGGREAAKKEETEIKIEKKNDKNGEIVGKQGGDKKV